VNLLERWPHEFGLAEDSTYAKVRSNHYPSSHGMGCFNSQGLGIKIRVLSPFHAFEASAFSNPLEMEDPARLREWVHKLRGSKDWDLCLLSRLTPTQALVLRESLGSRIVRTAEQKIWAVAPSGDFDLHLRQLSERFRKQYRNQRRALERSGFALEPLHSVDELLSLYQCRHSRKGADDYSMDPRFQEFVRELWFALQSEGRLVARGLRSGSVVIGGVLAFVSGNNLHVFQVAYDPAYSDLSPGRNTLVELLRDQWAQGHRVIDFMSERDYVGSVSGSYLGYQKARIFGSTGRGFLLSMRASASEWFRSFGLR